MNKTAQNARSFFKNATQPTNEFTESFESVSPIQAPAIAIPIAGLTQKEEFVIQKILVDEFVPGAISESRVSQDVEELTNITKQIKSIAAQSVLLHGERIQQAQKLLANYREGAFTKWLMSTYGNRQTPYSMLRYYEFHQNAPKDLRGMIEAAPKKGVYLLASREGDEKRKMDLIREHGNKPQAKFVQEIQAAFPVMEASKRKPLMASTIESMENFAKKVETRSQYLSEDDRIDVEKLIQRLKML